MSVTSVSCSVAPWNAFEKGVVRWKDFSATEQEAIVGHYSPKIRFLAQKLKKRLSSSTATEMNDLISSGSLGLMEAIGKFRPSFGIRFDTYAESRITGAMLDDLRRQDWLPRSARQNARRLCEVAEYFENVQGRPASEKEYAEMTGLSLKDVRSGLEALRGIQCIPLETFADALSMDRIESGGIPCAEAIRQDLMEKLATVIGSLTDRERTVLSLYYVEELKMGEIASILHITEGRVSQLRTQALSRLRMLFYSRYGE